MVVDNSSLKTLKISEKLHEYLKQHGLKSETYEDIIWRLIKDRDIKK